MSHACRWTRDTRVSRHPRVNSPPARQQKARQIYHNTVSGALLAGMEAKRKRLPATPTDAPRNGSDVAKGIAAMCEDCEPCELRPRAFFVAWSGVMTLAWHGFPPVLAGLKRRIVETFPALSPEKPGSKWPKTTLGCLKEGARLTPDQLRKLTQLCDRFFMSLPAAERELSPLATTPNFEPVDSLSVVLFQCRSLERVLSEHEVRLGGQTRNRDRPERDEETVVDRVLVESSVENLERYWPLVARDGGREGHYRDVNFGATLVARLKRLPAAVAQFRLAVDEALPGMYVWFDDSSLHVTLRGLVDPP